MNYSFNDILVGFRQKYLFIQNKIKELEKFINIIDQELLKCNIVLDDENDKNNISIYFHEKEKYIIAATINIENNLGMCLYHLNNLTYDTNITSVYHFRNNLKHYHIIIEEMKQFNDQVLNILNSQFMLKMKHNSIETNYNNNLYDLEYNYNTLKQEDINGNNNIKGINYYANKDFVKINYIGNISNNLLQDNLNIKYDSNNFNDYQKNIIESNNKKIVLFDENTNNHEFKIEEESKRLVLVKR